MIMKTGLALCLAGTLQAPAQIAATDLENWLARVITNVVYRPPGQAELARAEALFEHTLRGDRPEAELRNGWQELGLRLQTVSAGEESMWLVCEPQGEEFGRGWYLFRTNTASASFAWEAPHAKNDVHTGVISLRMFLAGDARVLAASTITRHRADMAHLDDTYFQAFTKAFAAVCPDGTITQLHGFETANHNGIGADIIASAGTAAPEPWFKTTVDRLREATGLKVAAYPYDIRQLGATTNAQGKLLQKTGRCRFLHVEMTLELRERMTRDQKLRSAFLKSLDAARK